MESLRCETVVSGLLQSVTYLEDTRIVIVRVRFKAVIESVKRWVWLGFSFRQRGRGRSCLSGQERAGYEEARR